MTSYTYGIVHLRGFIASVAPPKHCKRASLAAEFTKYPDLGVRLLIRTHRTQDPRLVGSRY